MKRILLVSLLACVLLALTACRGDNGNGIQNNDTQPPPQQVQQPEQTPPTSPDQTQDNSPSDTTVAPEARPASGSYYTFGDVINLWDNWEITFFDDVIITRPTRTPSTNEPERVHQFYDGYVIKIPTSLTNIGETGPDNFMVNYMVLSSTGEVYAMHDHIAIGRLMLCPTLGRVPGITHDVDAGETIEGYFFMVFDGDGDYWIQWPGQGIDVKLPISR
jgi:hypothetical protein